MAFSALGFVGFVHLAAIIFSVIELGLVAYLVHVYDSGGTNNSPSVVNFMLFNTIYSILILLYVGLSPLYYTRIFHRLASLALESLAMIFWFAGSIALAVKVGGPFHCGKDHFCGATEASIAFGFFLWALFLFLVVVDTIEALRSRGHTSKTNFGHSRV